VLPCSIAGWHLDGPPNLLACPYRRQYDEKDSIDARHSSAKVADPGDWAGGYGAYPTSPGETSSTDSGGDQQRRNQNNRRNGRRSAGSHDTNSGDDDSSDHEWQSPGPPSRQQRLAPVTFVAV
jgi:hypothetical protein